MNIDLVIAPRFIKDCTQIYHGLDHCCRCGCGGKYFKRGTRGFKMALTKLSKIDPLPTGSVMYARGGRTVKTEGISRGSNYVNIPVDSDHDKCYCLYFD